MHEPDAGVAPPGDPRRHGLPRRPLAATRSAGPTAQDQVADLELIIKSCEESAEQRLVSPSTTASRPVPSCCSVSTLSPLNLEPAVHAIAPFVAPGFRRSGVGHTLMEAAVT